MLTLIADDDKHLQNLFDLDHATNDRLLGENNLLPGIGLAELVYGVPGYRMVNAAFCHASPLGGRFNGPDRGVWYAGFELETAQAEVLFHKSVQLAEVEWDEEEVVDYQDLLANFDAKFHDLRDATDFEDCLSPTSYAASQALAARLLAAGSGGVVYPSVRRAGGTSLACFRPALVGNVRQGLEYVFHWRGMDTPACMRPA
ncbi:MAG: RES family NAD+ phosphorylase [Desulfovibrionaceae bacterium]